MRVFRSNRAPAAPRRPAQVLLSRARDPKHVSHPSEIQTMTPPTAADVRKKADLHLAASRPRLPLGEVLLRSGAVTQAQLDAALKQQNSGNKERLGRVL